MNLSNVQRGFTRFPNTLLDALCRFHCSGGQKDVLLAIIRLTIGYNRDSREVGVSRLAKMIRRDKGKVASDLRELIKRKVVLVESEHSSTKSKTLMINGDVSQWVCKKKPTPNVSDHTCVDESVQHSIKDMITRKTVSGRDSEREAEATAIYEYYASTVRPGARADAIRNINKRLSQGIDAAILKACIDHYVARGLAEDVQFRIQCNNFFGRSERFKEFLEPPKSQNRQLIDTVESDPKYQQMIREGVSNESE